MNWGVVQYGSVVHTLAWEAFEYHNTDLKEVGCPRSSLSLKRSSLSAQPLSLMPPGPLAMVERPWYSSWMISGGGFRAERRS